MNGLVTPPISGGRLLPSFLLNVDQQNVGCYINSFLTFLGGEEIELRVALAGISQISSAKIFRSKNGGEFSLLQDLSEISSFQTIKDKEYGDGLTDYLLEVETISGDLFTRSIRVFASKDSYIPFPTIVTSGFFNLVSPDTGGSLEIINNQGFMVKQQSIDVEREFVDVIDLPSGLYQYRIKKAGEVLSRGRIIIR